MKKRRVLLFIVPAAVVLVMIVAVLYHYKDPLARWYSVKKIEHRGILFTKQAFLGEVSQNNEETVDLFLKAGAKLDATNEKGQTALMIASDKGYMNTLNKLARLDPSLLNYADTNGNTALMAAARQGREEIVKALVGAGADVNYRVPRNVGAATALQSALEVPDLNAEQMRLITYLLEQGAHAKDRNGSGWFPLLLAADRGRTDVAKVLIEHGADVNDSDPKGGFPLLSAACNGRSEFVRFLAEQGANFKMTSADGYTPLMCAAQKGHLDTVRVLIEREAKVDAKTTAGSTALAEAMKAGNVDVARLLLQHGADPDSGYVPEAFAALQGKVIAINAKKKTIRNLMGLIAKAASQDGYTVTIKTGKEQKMNLTVKASWNKVLLGLARKNHLVLVVKEKEIVVLP